MLNPNSSITQTEPQKLAGSETDFTGSPMSCVLRDQAPALRAVVFDQSAQEPHLRNTAFIYTPSPDHLRNEDDPFSDEQTVARIPLQPLEMPNAAYWANLFAAAPRMLSALKALTAGMDRDEVSQMFMGHWLDALDAIEAAEGRPIPPRHKSTVSLVPQPCETDWEKRLWYCYCGHPRSIDQHLEVEKCPSCGDKQFDLSEQMESVP